MRSIIISSAALAVATLTLPAHAQRAMQPLSSNLRGTGIISLPGGGEQSVNVLRIKLNSDHTARIVAEGADVPPVEFSGRWSGPVAKVVGLKLTRAFKDVKATATGRVYLRTAKDVDRIEITGKSTGRDFTLDFTPKKPPVIAFKELSLTATGTGVVKMPDGTQENIQQLGLTLRKNGQAQVTINGNAEGTFGGKWFHPGNSELIRLNITSGFGNAGGTGKGTITLRSATELENLYFTSKASEGVVYGIRFTAKDSTTGPADRPAYHRDKTGNTR